MSVTETAPLRWLRALLGPRRLAWSGSSSPRSRAFSRPARGTDRSLLPFPSAFAFCLLYPVPPGRRVVCWGEGTGGEGLRSPKADDHTHPFRPKVRTSGARAPPGLPPFRSNAPGTRAFRASCHSRGHPETGRGMATPTAPFCRAAQTSVVQPGVFPLPLLAESPQPHQGQFPLEPSATFAIVHKFSKN